MAQWQSHEVNQAYRHCLNLVRSHYENFPVASLAIPGRLRKPISAIYAFARSADDIADEGNLPAEERLRKLNDYTEKLRHIGHPAPDEPIFIALAHTIETHNLPVQLFHDLLTAFKQDVTKTRYRDFSEVLAYCAHSANPVGRLLLHLTGQATADNLRRSDAICSALQIINFLQDIEQDYVENNRIYLPQDDMRRFGVTEHHIQHHECDAALRALLESQRARVKTLMLEGALLGKRIKGRFGLQLRIMINGGWRVLQLIDLQKENCFSRPRLQRRDWLWLTWNAVWKTGIESRMTEQVQQCTQRKLN